MIKKIFFTIDCDMCGDVYFELRSVWFLAAVVLMLVVVCNFLYRVVCNFLYRVVWPFLVSLGTSIWSGLTGFAESTSSFLGIQVDTLSGIFADWVSTLWYWCGDIFTEIMEFGHFLLFNDIGNAWLAVIVVPFSLYRLHKWSIKLCHQMEIDYYRSK